MKIIVLMSRDLEKPSTKFRLVQYLPFLQERGIEVEFVKKTSITPNLLQRIQEADIVLNQKCVIRRSWVKKLISHAKYTIFDFDDAIHTRSGKAFSLITQIRQIWRLKYIFQHANLVTTANEVLANFARKYTSNVQVINMGIDTQQWCPPKNENNRPITIGWMGSPANVHRLSALDPILCQLKQKYPFITIAVFCGKKPNIHCDYEYHPYRPDGEATFAQRLSIGLLPLDDNEYDRGKSPIKAFQYLACEVPVVGNAFGATAEILTPENSLVVHHKQDWFSHLEKLILDPPFAHQLGQNGRNFIERKHSLTTIAEQLCQIFQQAKSVS